MAMKHQLKKIFTLGALSGAVVMVTQSNSFAGAAQNVAYNAGPPVRISLHYGYHGYYRPFLPSYYGWGYPRIGFSIGFLPLGYTPFYFGTTLYYYYDGVYYRPYNNGYQVAVPPVGAEVPQLPPHVRSIMIDGQQYYTMNGVYYKPEPKPDGTTAFIIAGKDGVLNTTMPSLPPASGNVPAPNTEPAPAPNAPVSNVAPPSAMPPVVYNTPKVGDVVNNLPDGCKSVNVAGKTYFLSPDEVYYEQVIDGKNIVYRVQGVPSAGNKQ